jgi:hypothetical protein
MTTDDRNAHIHDAPTVALDVQRPSRPLRGLLSLKTILGSQRIQAEHFFCARILWPVSNVFREQRRAIERAARSGA